MLTFIIHYSDFHENFTKLIYHRKGSKVKRDYDLLKRYASCLNFLISKSDLNIFFKSDNIERVANSKIHISRIVRNDHNSHLPDTIGTYDFSQILNFFRRKSHFTLSHNCHTHVSKPFKIQKHIYIFIYYINIYK